MTFTTIKTFKKCIRVRRIGRNRHQLKRTWTLSIRRNKYAQKFKKIVRRVVSCKCSYDKKNGTEGNFWRWWICLLPWFWRWFHGCMHLSNLITLYTLNMCRFLHMLYLNKTFFFEKMLFLWIACVFCPNGIVTYCNKTANWD